MKPLKIAIVSHSYPTFNGGYAGQFVHELARATVKLGHKVYAVVPEPSGETGRSSMDGVQLEFFKAGDRVSYGNATNDYIRIPRLELAKTMVRAVKKLHHIVREKGIDVIHAHWALPMGFVGTCVKIITHTPLVITTHGRDVYIDKNSGAIVPSLPYVKPFLRFVLNKADQIIAVSEDCASQAIRRGAPPDRMAVIWNGVSLEHFFPMDNGMGRFEQEYCLDDESRIILIVASLMQYKGIDILIGSMPVILAKEPQAKLMVIGKGPEQASLEELVNSLGLQDHVLFISAVNNIEVNQYLNACEVFVLPSRRESFGIAAVEAMACAKPVVASQVGGLKGVIQDGVDGLLVKPDSVEDLAEAILKILDDKSFANRLGKNARIRVERELNWNVSAVKTVALYKKLVVEQK